MIGHQQLRGVLGQRLARQAVLRRPIEEMAGQQDHVLAPFAQRRQRHRHDIEPIIEILTEPVFLDQPRQVLVGGGDDADIDADRLRPADRGHFARLEHAEQPCLRLHRHVADFIQEQGAALRLFELAGGPRLRTGKGPLFVAEQFGFDQFARNGRHVDRDKGTGATLTQAMDGFGHQLLARSRLAQHQDAEIIGKNAGNGAIDFLHRRRSPHQRQAVMRQSLLARVRPARSMPQGVRNSARQLIEIKRLW